MKKSDIIEKYAEDNLGLVRLSELEKLGISKQYCIEHLKKNGYTRLARGLYLHKEGGFDDLYEFQSRYKLPFSHYTALYLDGLTEQEPFGIYVTAKKGYHTESLRGSNVKIKRVTKALYGVGLCEYVTPMGFTVTGYDTERSLCDILCIRNVESSVKSYAFKNYLNRVNRDIAKLQAYAKLLHCEKPLHDLLEILL